MDYVSKVEDLKEAAKSISTLQSVLDLDVKDNCVRRPQSHSRNLLRVKRGIDMVRVLFEEILAVDGNSLKDPASMAYAKVFAPHHGWAIRKAVAAGMYALPSRILRRWLTLKCLLHIMGGQLGRQLLQECMHCPQGLSS
ncbi:hypothetical protein HPP92_017147 [Vanilla planifolia]|uniref:Glycolipid transfer protein domain-containing protein n=1 Tax=Vanilla planifolia TaxID=51239 RepID=A0A835QDX8_VANPL|nr:hypothetical protein HPP92_017147 [Vanilla planifolia]